MAALALVPFAPLLALPPRLVAAAASCACLLGGAALGVARVRAGEPRAAEVATATFAAVGATLAVSAWWLLASGGVGTVRGGSSGGGEEREKGKWSRRKEAVRGAVNGGTDDGTGASSSSSSSSSLKQQRPLALAARFASVPWKAAQRASRAGNALCPFTGGFMRKEKGRGKNCRHPVFSSDLERVPPRRRQKKKQKNVRRARHPALPLLQGHRLQERLALRGQVLRARPRRGALALAACRGGAGAGKSFFFLFKTKRHPLSFVSLNRNAFLPSLSFPKTTGELPDGEQDQARHGPGPQGKLPVR